MKGVLIQGQEEDKSIVKEQPMGERIKELLRNGDFKTVSEEFAEQSSCNRMLVLWEILFEADLEDDQELEEKIYAYGSRLAAKDTLGRLFFTRMVTWLRMIQNAKQIEKKN